MGSQDAGTRIAGCILSFALALVLAAVLAVSLLCISMHLALQIGIYSEGIIEILLNYGPLFVSIGVFFALWWSIYKTRFASRDD